MTILSRRFKKVFQTPYYLCPIASLVCGLYLSSFSVGAERSAPVIQAIERFYARPVLNADDEPIAVDRITAGRLLIGELNCLSCHPASDSFRMSIDTKQAPILDDVGSRVRREWLREYLTKPHASKPGTTMPDVIAAIPEKDRVSTVDALAHFLIQSGTPIESHPNLSSAKRGDELFHKIGCVACHEPLNGIEPKPLASISLQNVDKKYTVSSLIGFLKNPLAVRPSGRMPTFSLKDEEYRDIAQRLVRSVDLTPNVHFSVHEATTDTFPDFEKQQPIAKGQCAGFDLEVAKRTSDFAIRFSTWLTVKQPGEFQITLGSDDWSRLFVNNKTVVDNGGTHPHQTKTGSVSLEAGSHPVIVDFFQRGGEWTLEVDVSGPGFKQQPLANFCTLESEGRSSDRPNTTSSPRESSSDPLLIEQGRKLFASLGCAACHSLKQGDQRIESTLKSKPLDELNVENGCLSSTNPGIAPRFGLSVIQLELIRSALNAKDHAEPASETIHRQMAWLNCYACHRRGYFGGVEKDRDPFFTTHQKEMGDEGRIPPSLNGVGDKLRPEFLKEVLHQGGSDRKHSMVTRMPKFGPDNVGRLMELFQAVDTKSDPLPERKIPEPEYRIKGAGRHLVGAQALACIKCHDFGPHPSTGIRAISLTRMHHRLRPEWFDRYLRDPQLFRPGTRMPAPWPFGQATIREVLSANVDWQIGAVWSYLSDGEKAAVPIGIVREPIELKPTSEPVIYRNFITGAGTRAIGVGYPEKVNLAWDANEMTMALIWHGPFINASRHWTGRGDGSEGPLGDHIIMFAQNSPFARLNPPTDPWPTVPARESGYRFLGYRLDEKGRPTFLYSFQNLTIEETPSPVMPPPIASDSQPNQASSVGLKRTLTIRPSTPSAGSVYFRAARFDSIEKLSETDYRIDRFWTTRVTGVGPPSIRKMGEKTELIVPISFGTNTDTLTIAQEYLW